MIVDALLLILGFVILLFGADKLVDGGAALAHRLNVPNMVIGLTIVAFGTSAPELVVSVISSFSGKPELALGNVVGSNIFNVCGILGVTAMVFPIAIKKATTWIDVPFALLAALLILFMFGNQYRDVPPEYVISRPEGIVLLCLFVVFVCYTFVLGKKGKAEEIEIKSLSLAKSVLFIAIGLVGLVAGGQLLVKGAVGLAEAFGISQRVIAVTILAIGTSLPELATSLVAARKKNVDLAVGNVVGSNIFNSFLILGSSATIAPIPVTPESLTDILVNLLASALLFLFIFTGKGRQIERWEGGIFVLLYLVYMGGLLFLGAGGEL